MVITIIAILASLLLPALAHSRRIGQTATCRNNERQLGIALATYLVDNNGAFPFTAYVPAAGPKWAVCWYDALRPYAGNTPWDRGVFKCPSYKWKIFEGGGSPAGNDVVSSLGSYSWNGVGALGGASPGGLGSLYFPKAPRGAITDTEIKVPSDMFALGDSKLMEGWPNGFKGGSWEYPNAYYWDQNSFFITATNLSQHRDFNMLFVDGHVLEMKRDKVFNSTNSVCLSHWSRDHSPLR